MLRGYCAYSEMVVLCNPSGGRSNKIVFRETCSVHGLPCCGPYPKPAKDNHPLLQERKGQLSQKLSKK